MIPHTEQSTKPYSSLFLRTSDVGVEACLYFSSHFPNPRAALHRTLLEKQKGGDKEASIAGFGPKVERNLLQNAKRSRYLLVGERAAAAFIQQAGPRQHSCSSFRFCCCRKLDPSRVTRSEFPFLASDLCHSLFLQFFVSDVPVTKQYPTYYLSANKVGSIRKTCAWLVL